MAGQVELLAGQVNFRGSLASSVLEFMLHSEHKCQYLQLWFHPEGRAEM